MLTHIIRMFDVGRVGSCVLRESERARNVRAIYFVVITLLYGSCWAINSASGILSGMLLYHLTVPFCIKVSVEYMFCWSIVRAMRFQNQLRYIYGFVEFVCYVLIFRRVNAKLNFRLIEMNFFKTYRTVESGLMSFFQASWFFFFI